MADAALTLSTQHRRRRGALDFARSQPLGAISFVVIAVMMAAGVFAAIAAPYNPLAIDFTAILTPPSPAHLFGTDNFGRDVFSRIIWGTRTALVIGFTSSLLGCALGSLIGIAS